MIGTLEILGIIEYLLYCRDFLIEVALHKLSTDRSVLTFDL